MLYRTMQPEYKPAEYLSIVKCVSNLSQICPNCYISVSLILGGMYGGYQSKRFRRFTHVEFLMTAIRGLTLHAVFATNACQNPYLVEDSSTTILCSGSHA